MNVQKTMEVAPTPVRTHLEVQTASAPLVSCLEMTGSLVKVHLYETWFPSLREEHELGAEGIFEPKKEEITGW
jgi:hypothetical protein